MSPKTLRILVVLPLYGGSLPVGRFAAAALSRLGHVVEVFEAPGFYGAFTSLTDIRVAKSRQAELENSFLQVVGQAVFAKAETFAPDLVLAMAQAPLPRAVLSKLRKMGVPTCMWFVEDFRLFTYWQAFAPHYDLFAVIQKEPFFDKLADIGCKNVVYLPLAADPQFHQPLDPSPVRRRKYGSQISFLGAGYANRRVFFRELIGQDLKIWGNDWDGEDVLSRHLQRAGQRISSQECVEIFNATDVNVNLHSSIHARPPVQPGDFVNPRTFELAMCGAFQLVDRRALLPELFSEDELAQFSDVSEFKDKLAYFLAHPEERARFALAARTRAVAEHSYEARMQTLLAFAATRLPSLSAAQTAPSQSALDAVPEPLRGQVAELLARLGLSAEVAFADLIWELRARQGELSSLETSLLFLDEWRKQYVN